jgi:hypothetical protein
MPAPVARLSVREDRARPLMPAIVCRTCRRAVDQASAFDALAGGRAGALSTIPSAPSSRKRQYSSRPCGAPPRARDRSTLRRGHEAPRNKGTTTQRGTPDRAHRQDRQRTSSVNERARARSTATRTPRFVLSSARRLRLGASASLRSHALTSHWRRRPRPVFAPCHVEVLARLLAPLILADHRQLRYRP